MVSFYYVEDISSDSLFEYRRLCSDNYLTWSFLLKLQLRRKHLWQFIDGSALKPEPSLLPSSIIPTYKNSEKEWKRIDNEVTLIILSTIEESQYIHFIRNDDYYTSRDVWEELSIAHSGRASISR